VLAPAKSLAHLLDADVALRGVCGALFNGKHQMLGIQMFVPGAECIRVLRAPSPDPFSDGAHSHCGSPAVFARARYGT
jgi:hypothetical protein